MQQRRGTDEQMPIEQVRRRLERDGVAAGPNGYDVAALSAAIASRGLLPPAIDRDGDGYQATITVNPGEPETHPCICRGASPDEALARAMVAYADYMAPGS